MQNAPRTLIAAVLLWDRGAISDDCAEPAGGDVSACVTARACQLSGDAHTKAVHDSILGTLANIQTDTEKRSTRAAPAYARVHLTEHHHQRPTPAPTVIASGRRAKSECGTPQIPSDNHGPPHSGKSRLSSAPSLRLSCPLATESKFWICDASGVVGPLPQRPTRPISAR